MVWSGWRSRVMLGCWLAGSVVALAATDVPPAASVARFDEAARAGERLTVAFFGASLTWGANATDHARTSYRARVAQKMEVAYPEARFTYVDGAIGGTCSDLGVFRLQRDCLRYKPDLVFLDFSANDNIDDAAPELLASYESLVRRIILEGRCPVVPVIFPFKWNARPGTADRMRGRVAHLAIAEAYHAPVGDAIVTIQDLAADDPGVVDRIWNIDGVHPGDFGYQLFADAAWQGFERGVASGEACRAPDAMLHADTYMTWSRNRISQLGALPAGWQPGLVSRRSAWYDGLMSRWLDDVVIVRGGRAPKGKEGKTAVKVEPLVVRFKAKTVMMFGEETIRSGKYKAFIDGEAATWKDRGNVHDVFDLSSVRHRGNRQHAAVLATGLDADRVHELRLVPVFDAGENQELRMESICLAGGEARVVDE